MSGSYQCSHLPVYHFAAQFAQGLVDVMQSAANLTTMFGDQMLVQKQ